MKETKIEKMYNNVFKMKQNINLLSKYVYMKIYIKCMNIV